MEQARIMPDDPLEFIRRRVTALEMLWTYHVNMRLQKRGISRRTILESVPT